MLLRVPPFTCLTNTVANGNQLQHMWIRISSGQAWAGGTHSANSNQLLHMCFRIGLDLVEYSCIPPPSLQPQGRVVGLRGVVFHETHASRLSESAVSCLLYDLCVVQRHFWGSVGPWSNKKPHFSESCVWFCNGQSLVHISFSFLVHIGFFFSTFLGGGGGGGFIFLGGVGVCGGKGGGFSALREGGWYIHGGIFWGASAVAGPRGRELLKPQNISFFPTWGARGYVAPLGEPEVM